MRNHISNKRRSRNQEFLWPFVSCIRLFFSVNFLASFRILYWRLTPRLFSKFNITFASNITSFIPYKRIHQSIVRLCSRPSRCIRCFFSLRLYPKPLCNWVIKDLFYLRFKNFLNPTSFLKSILIKNFRIWISAKPLSILAKSLNSLFIFLKTSRPDFSRILYTL